MTKSGLFTMALTLFFAHVLHPMDRHRELDSLKVLLANSQGDDRQRADLYNAIGYAYWIINPDSSLSYGTKAMLLSQKLGYPSGESFSKRIIGVAHWAQGNTDKALDHLTASHALYKALNDREGQANTILNMGLVHADLEHYGTALEHYQTAVATFTSLGLDGRIATTFTKMAHVYLELDQFDRAEGYLLDALETHTAHGFKYGMAEAHNGLGLLYLEKGDTELAYNHIQLSILIGTPLLDKDGLTSNLIVLGNIHIREGQLERAEVSLLQALQQAEENHLKKHRLAIYGALKELRTLQKRPEAALVLANRFIALKDSLYHIQRTQQHAHWASQYTSWQNERDALLAQNRNMPSWPVLLLLVLVPPLALYLFQQIRKSPSLGDPKEVKKLRAELLQARQDLSHAQKKGKEMANELETKNQELVAHALNIAHKNEFLQSLRAQTADLMENPQPQSAGGLKSLYLALQHHLASNRDWEDFKIIFETVHSEFYPKLTAKHPNLKANDLKICSFIRLNLSIKEIANIMAVSPDSIKTARYRLRKKLQLSPNQDIVTYLVDIENGTAPSMDP